MPQQRDNRLVSQIWRNMKVPHQVLEKQKSRNHYAANSGVQKIWICSFSDKYLSYLRVI